MNLFLHGIGPDGDDDGASRRSDRRRACATSPAHADVSGPHQPAVRQEVVDHRRQRGGRDRPPDAHLQPARLLDDDLEQAAQLRPAREVAAEDPRPRRRRRARQRAVRGRRRRDGAPEAAAGVRRPHAAAPADRHLLRPGRQGERALLRPQARREGAVDEEGLGLRPAHEQALHAQDPAHDARRPRRVRRVLPPGDRHNRKATWSRREDARRPLAPTATTRSSPATRCSLDLFWLRDESLEDSASLPEPHVLAQEIADDLRSALAQIERSDRCSSRGAPRSGARADSPRSRGADRLRLNPSSCP
jgi:hypothetical protein